MLLSEYAYLLKVDGRIYTNTDVYDLHVWVSAVCPYFKWKGKEEKLLLSWMAECMERHPLFERIPDNDLKEDICFKTMFTATEEGQKVTRQGGHNKEGQKWPAVFRRLPNP